MPRIPSPRIVDGAAIDAKPDEPGAAGRGFGVRTTTSGSGKPKATKAIQSSGIGKHGETEMKNVRKWAACMLIPVLMTGCANMEQKAGVDAKRNWCVAGGAVAGATAGAVGGEVVGALIGLTGGAVLGRLLCDENDSDGDGVMDGADQCPNTPAEASGAVNDEGCPLFSDGDNVPDYLDACPDTAAGVTVDDQGCPIDSDGDGFSDDADACPQEAAPESEDGCIVEICEPLAIITNANFDFDSARIRSDAEAKLAGVVEVLTATPEVLVRVVGHADSTGPEGYNLRLSLRRAEGVRTYLAEQGVAMERMDASGKGESEPLVSNRTRAGRAVNRRVEFLVQNEVCM